MLDWFLPRGWLARLGPGRRLGAGSLAVCAGAAMGGNAALTLRRLGTNINPMQPTLAIATEGVFARTRNPMYVGGGLALAGLAIGLALDWVLLLLVPSFLLLHFGVILREEQYLERKFGGSYRRYKASVPRYGWRI
jgi:protein-S-isoprenylcysteine O-methyltransferase Ste14